MSKQVTCVILGAGNRGQVYAGFALDFPNELKVVAFSEPREFYRKRFAERHNIAKANIFSDWRDLMKCERLADFVIVALPDALHKEAAICASKLKYHVLLEKPMAVSYSDCVAIKQACEENGVYLSVCHVLRYTPQARKIHELIRDKTIGDLVNLQLVDPVGYWHFAHSFVRGNWRNESGSGFSLLTKCCHDLDLLNYWMNAQNLKCQQVQSFGSLKHFVSKNKPAQGASRCLDCAVEDSCVYSAKKIYLSRAEKGDKGWPLDVICEVPDIESVGVALRSGPYGRCVYDCDNDVMDNQVVNLTFDNNATASFTMVAFTADVGTRKIRVFGTKGELYCDFETDEIVHIDFMKDTKETIHCSHTDSAIQSRLKGHGLADFYNMSAFVQAVSRNDPSSILTGPDVSLEAHKLVFLAEASRKQNCIVNVNDYNFDLLK